MNSRQLMRCLKQTVGHLKNTRHLTIGRNLPVTWSAVRKIPSTLPTHYGRKHSQAFMSYTLLTRPMSTAKFEVINVQDEDDFKKRVLEQSSSIPVVVDFHATWCGPCKVLGPRLESLLSKENGKVLMAKVDIDEHAELAMEYGVRSVPTVVGVKNGQVQNQFIGVKDDDQIGSFVDYLIAS